MLKKFPKNKNKKRMRSSARAGPIIGTQKIVPKKCSKIIFQKNISKKYN
jgi:hypothetical protein